PVPTSCIHLLTIPCGQILELGSYNCSKMPITDQNIEDKLNTIEWNGELARLSSIGSEGLEECSCPRGMGQATLTTIDSLDKEVWDSFDEFKAMTPVASAATRIMVNFDSPEPPTSTPSKTEFL
uniref:Uncharacterized protein n=1 Tax=Mola mola TaxID=94237 RepID=A0A3Q3WWV6_MOLML